MPLPLIETEPLVPAVFTDDRDTVSPSESLVQDSTLMSIAVCLSVDALTFLATGRGFGLTVTVRETTLLRFLLADPSLTWKLIFRLLVAGDLPLESR